MMSFVCEEDLQPVLMLGKDGTNRNISNPGDILNCLLRTAKGQPVAGDTQKAHKTVVED